MVGKGKDKGFRIAECTYKFRDDIIITQRDRVPLQDPKAESQSDAKGRLVCDVIPNDFAINKGRGKKSKAVSWRWDKAKGIFQLGDTDITWRPVIVLGKFNKGTGYCEDHHSFIQLVQDMIDQDFSSESTTRYNKSALQWFGRNDSVALNKKGTTQPRWTREEHMQLVRDLNQITFENGLRWLYDNWKNTSDSVINQLRKLNDTWRQKTLKAPKRGPDAMRAKMSRSQRATAKVDDLKDASKELLDSHPRDFFTINHIDRHDEAKDGEVGEEEEVAVDDEGEGAGGEKEDQADDEAEDEAGGEAGGVAKRTAGGESDETEEPPRKKTKL